MCVPLCLFRRFELTEAQDLFNRIGPVAKLDLLYDRAGRSEGVAYVTYESADDALTAIAEFDGANANGMTSEVCNYTISN